VGATCLHTGHRGFLDRFSSFDVVVVDEVSKATPTELLLPCLLGKKVVLVGDHRQLPPIFGEEDSFAEAAAGLGLEADALQQRLRRSLFRERYVELDKEGLQRTLMLRIQYRMHPQIMDAINQFYGHELRTGVHDGDRQHGLTIPHWLVPNRHLLWVDLPQQQVWRHEEMSPGRRNAREGELALCVLQKLVAAHRASAPAGTVFEVGLISVYAAQARLLRDLVARSGLDRTKDVSIRVGTVDRFQGMERDVILVSLVLNAPNQRLSTFLQTPERINVALSRARRLLVILGSTHNYTQVPSEARGAYENVLQIARGCEGYVGDISDVME
jgi:superfamily I DNA and/or RNA helicase